MSLKIYLIGRPEFDVDSFTSFLQRERVSWARSDAAKAAEELVELGGRICYMSFEKNQSKMTNAEYIKNLIRNGHESVLEHVNWTFLITGVSRALTHQLVRHRIGFSFSQLSQQYHDETDAQFVEPAQIKGCRELETVWQNAVNVARDAYCKIKESFEKVHKVGGEDGPKELKQAARSVARSVLPNATESKMVITANARALRHFLKVRGSVANDQEMRALAAILLEHLKIEAPAVFFDFRTEWLSDSSPVVIKQD